MRTRTFVTTALLTGLLAFPGGTAAHAADPEPVLDSLESALFPDVGVNLCKNPIGLPSLTVGDNCARG